MHVFSAKVKDKGTIAQEVILEDYGFINGEIILKKDTEKVV